MKTPKAFSLEIHLWSDWQDKIRGYCDIIRESIHFTLPCQCSTTIP